MFLAKHQRLESLYTQLIVSSLLNYKVYEIANSSSVHEFNVDNHNNIDFLFFIPLCKIRPRSSASPII